MSDVNFEVDRQNQFKNTEIVNVSKLRFYYPLEKIRLSIEQQVQQQKQQIKVKTIA